MVRVYSYLAIISLAINSLNLAAQGCSDAGVCTAGSHSRTINTDNSRHGLGLSYIYGAGEQKTQIQTLQLQYDLSLGKGFAAQVKVPYIFANGNLGKSEGAGDIIAVLSKKMKIKSITLEPAVGARIATGTGNDAKVLSGLNKGKVLPMPYQTSLGTNDILVNVSMKLGKHTFAIGYQHPMNANANTFYAPEFDTTNGSQVLKYFPSYKLVRKPDVILRADRHMNFRKWQISPGILAIYKIAEEEMETNPMGPVSAVKPISGSDGLTLNILVNIKRVIAQKVTLNVGAATPLVVRKNRPDGLTRAFVISAGLSMAL